MPLSTKRKYRFPNSKAGPDLAAHLAALAEDIDLDVDALDQAVGLDVSALAERMETLEEKEDDSLGRGVRMPVDDVAFAVADSSRRQSWLAVTRSGGVPQHTARLLADALRSALTGGTAHKSTPTDVAYVVTDKTGRRSELEIGPDGRLTQRVIDSISSRLPSAEPKYATALACWGDSLTASQMPWSNVTQKGQAEPPWPEALGADLGVPVFNGGKGAHGSAEIATRQGGLRPLLTVAGNQIPASGPVTVESIQPTNGWRKGADNFSLSINGTLAGIPGVLSRDLSTGVRTFIRTAPGTAARAVAPGTPFIGTDGHAWRDAVHVIWAGTNNSDESAAILRDIDSMVAWLAPHTSRYVVLPLTAGSSSLNASIASRYAGHFEDHRAHLIANGLAEAGITPTEADRTAMAANRMPPSLTYDGIHFTQAGYDVIHRFMARRLRARGYFA